MRPGKFFERWFLHHNTYLHGYEDDYRKTFEKGREYERVYGAKPIALAKAVALCKKFVDKVESGRARSRETYAECKAFLRILQ